MLHVVNKYKKVKRKLGRPREFSNITKPHKEAIINNGTSAAWSVFVIIFKSLIINLNYILQSKKKIYFKIFHKNVKNILFRGSFSFARITLRRTSSLLFEQ